MKPISALLLSCAVAAGTTASAQTEKGPPREGEREDVQFDWPNGRRPPDAEGEALTPIQRLEKAMPGMISWPKDSGENVIRATVVRGGAELIPPLQNFLRHGTVLERAAAARALCLLRDKESIADIESLFFDKRQSTRVTPLLLSLSELDAFHTDGLARRFVASKSSVLRRAAVHFFRAQAAAEANGDERDLASSATTGDTATEVGEPRAALTDDLVTLLSESEFDEVRRDVFGLLRDLDPNQVTQHAMELIGDSDAPLAQKVAEHLIDLASDDLDEALRVRGTADRDRPGLHAQMILAARERRSRQPVLEDASFDVFLSDVRSSDPLLRSVACVVCGVLALRDESRQEVLDKTVLPALFDVVLHGRFHPDFRFCHAQAVAVLERLTGETLGASVPAWREYWEQRGGASLRSVRELLAAEAAIDAPVGRVQLQTWEALGQWGEGLTLLGPSFRSRVLRGDLQGILLESSAMEAVLSALNRDGFFRSDLPRELSEHVVGAHRLTLDIRGRARAVVAPPASEEMATWVRTLDDVRRQHAWQALLPEGDDFAERFRGEEAWWRVERDEAEAARHHLDLVLSALEGSPDRWVTTLEVLDSLAGVEEHATTAQIARTARILGSITTRDRRTTRLIELLAEYPDAQAFDALVDALSSWGARAREPLRDALARRGEAAERLSDPRSLVRQAALDVFDGAAQVPEAVGLMARTDPDGAVRARALEVLSATDSGAAVDVLLRQANSDETATRLAALKALGSVDRIEALEALNRAAYDEDLGVVQAAIEGLGLRADERAATTLHALVTAHGASEVRGYLALATLRSLPAEWALPRLRALRDEGSGEVAREAVSGLADLGAMDVVPTLLEWLEEPGTHRRGLTKLTYLFARDFSEDLSRYRALYESAPERTHDEHVLEVLGELGHDVAGATRLDDESIRPVLVEALRDERWFVRRSALEALERGTGIELGTLSTSAEAAARDAFAARWREALADQR